MRPRSRLSLPLLALSALVSLACGRERDPAPTSEAAGPADPRLPRGFDVPLPEGATVRWGATADGEARAILTAEAAPDAARAAVERAFRGRGWDPGRDGDAVVVEVGGRERARATVAAGPSGLTRIELREPRVGRVEGPDEPAAWRRIDRPPLPAPPGEANRVCAAAVQAACARWAEAGGGDALDCGLDHRAACGRTDAEAYLRRALEDADARLAAALRAHDMVGSPAARAETGAQVALERLAARAVIGRAAAAGIADVPASLRERLSAARDIGPPDPDLDGWWERNTEDDAPVEPDEPSDQERD